MAVSPEELEEAASAFQHIWFQEDEPSSKCGSGSLDGRAPSSGAFSGVIPSMPSAPPTNQGLPQRIRVSQGVSTGLLVTKVQPHHPDGAKQARIQGQVVLQALIDKNGDV